MTTSRRHITDTGSTNAQYTFHRNFSTENSAALLIFTKVSCACAKLISASNTTRWLHKLSRVFTQVLQKLILLHFLHIYLRKVILVPFGYLLRAILNCYRIFHRLNHLERLWIIGKQKSSRKMSPTNKLNKRMGGWHPSETPDVTVIVCDLRSHGVAVYDR